MRKLTLVVLILCAVPASAGPVDIRNESGVYDRWREACALWIEPESDQYRWTFVCAGEKDASETELDTAWIDVYSTLCEGDGSHGLPPAIREALPDPGTPCSHGSGFSGEVNLDEVTVELEAGTASVHAETLDCRLDLDWMAIGPAETETGSIILYGYQLGLYPGVRLVKVDLTTTERPASMTGDICPRAPVSGPPDQAWIAETEMTYHMLEVQRTPSDS